MAIDGLPKPTGLRKEADKSESGRQQSCEAATKHQPLNKVRLKSEAYKVITPWHQEVAAVHHNTKTLYRPQTETHATNHKGTHVVSGERLPYGQRWKGNTS